jgi:hypothetical protein
MFLGPDGKKYELPVQKGLTEQQMLAIAEERLRPTWEYNMALGAVIEHGLKAALIPPVLAFAIGSAFVWVFRGFK